MITPNKFIPYEDSILNKLQFLLSLNIAEINILDLYSKVSNKFDNIDEFILTIDVLYILDCIEIDFKTRMITYVNRNTF